MTANYPIILASVNLLPMKRFKEKRVNSITDESSQASDSLSYVTYGDLI